MDKHTQQVLCDVRLLVGGGGISKRHVYICVCCACVYICVSWACIYLWHASLSVMCASVCLYLCIVVICADGV